MKEKLRKFNYNLNNYKENLIKRKDCPICNSKKRKIMWAKVNSFFKAVKCTKCEFIYIDNILSKKGLNAYYNNYIDFRLKNKKKLNLRKKMYLIDLKYLKLYKNSGKLIDIGCSNGDFLKHLVKHYNAFGIDIDSQAIKIAKKFKVLKKRVSVLDLSDVKKKLGSFDVAVLRGVIEHVENPKKYFCFLQKILKKDGIIFISATPNVNSPSAIRFKDKWNQFDPIQHINLFSSKTIEKIAKVYGFKLVGEHYPYLETPYANFSENYKSFTSKKTKISPPFWGSMMTLILKK